MNLHEEFIKLGRERNRITYQLLALLPEIYRRKIYREKGYSTIEEYAGKLAGLSGEVVKKALGLDRSLQKAIETQGIHKVAIVANLVTPETDKIWADKVENMSTRGLQELSREIRGKKQRITIELDEEMQFLFLKLKKRMGISNNQEVLRQLLRNTTQPNRKIVTKIPAEKRDTSTKTCSRHIPAMQQHKLPEKCSYPNCNKPAEINHHCDRFSESHSHESVVPLCREHHEFAHNGLIAYEKLDPRNWQLNLEKTQLEAPDMLYRKYRQVALL